MLLNERFNRMHLVISPSRALDEVFHGLPHFLRAELVRVESALCEQVFAERA